MSALDLDAVEARAERKIQFGGFTDEDAFGTDADAATTLVLVARVRELEATNSRLNQRVQRAESNRQARHERYVALGLEAETAMSAIKALHRRLDNWEADGHRTVGIDFLRRHFDFPTIRSEPSRRNLRAILGGTS